MQPLKSSFDGGIGNAQVQLQKTKRPDLIS
jgi:hypothetical protein